MQYLGVNAFSRLIGERREVVKELLRLGAFQRVKMRSDRVEIGADDALDYLAKKYPHLIAAKSELNALAAGCVSKQIVKVESNEGIVKKGREEGSYIYDNYGN